MITQIIYEMASPVVALIAGILAYPYMSRFLRTLFFQLAFWIFTYSLTYVVTFYQKANGLTPNNQWVFNLYIPLEFLMLTMAVHSFVSDKPIRYMVLASYAAFLLLAANQVWINGLEKFINYSMALGGIIMTSLFILVSYKLFDSETTDWRHSPEILASLGLIIYFSCNVPFISSISYLNENSPDTGKKLFHYITDNLALIRYGMLAFAFLQLRKNNSNFYNAT